MLVGMVAVWSAGWNGGCLVYWLEFHSNQQNRQPPTQNDKYQCHIDRLSSLDDGHINARNM
jgi:hypothetical protein